MWHVSHMHVMCGSQYWYVNIMFLFSTAICVSCYEELVFSMGEITELSACNKPLGPTNVEDTNNLSVITKSWTRSSCHYSSKLTLCRSNLVTCVKPLAPPTISNFWSWITEVVFYWQPNCL